MMRITGPRRANRHLWISLLLAGPAMAYFVWPAGGEAEPEIVEVSRPTAEGAVHHDSSAAPVGFAKRALATVDPANLFESHSWFVAPPPAPIEPTRPTVPTAPPLPYTFLGSYARAGEPKVFFLVKGDRIFTAHVGEVLEKDYSVDAADNGQLLMTYLPLGIKQSLAVGVTQ